MCTAYFHILHLDSSWMVREVQPQICYHLWKVVGLNTKRSSRQFAEVQLLVNKGLVTIEILPI